MDGAKKNIFFPPFSLNPLAELVKLTRNITLSFFSIPWSKKTINHITTSQPEYVDPFCLEAQSERESFFPSSSSSFPYFFLLKHGAQKAG